MFCVLAFDHDLINFRLLAAFPNEALGEEDAARRRAATGEKIYGPYEFSLGDLDVKAFHDPYIDILAPLTAITFRHGAVEIMTCGDPVEIPLDRVSDPELAALQAGDTRMACLVAARYAAGPVPVLTPATPLPLDVDSSAEPDATAVAKVRYGENLVPAMLDSVTHFHIHEGSPV